MTVLAATGLRRTYGVGPTRVEALRGVDLVVGPAAHVALAGPSGSGKTTLLHVLGLLDRAFEGTLVLCGESIAAQSDARRAALRRTRIGFVFQSFQLLDEFDVRGNVALPHWREHGNRQAALARADALLADLGLAARGRAQPRQLSGGEAQRVAVARALVNDPLLVLADEPTGNLDRASAADVMAALHRVVQDGRTLIVASHDPDVLAAASQVVWLRDGAVVAAPAPAPARAA